MEIKDITKSELDYGMDLAIEKARQTMRKGLGGPFGAAVITPAGQIISVASNSVLGDNDPTAHAEINAIRQACKYLNTYDLSGYIVLATGFPCPMCLSAMIWANIDKCYYGCTPKDAEEIGFRDDFIYDFIQNNLEDETVLKLEELNRDQCLELFQEYSDTNKTIY